MTQKVMRVAEVASAIAALDIQGIGIHDLKDMKPALTARDCPLLGPDPSTESASFLTGWMSRRISMQGNQDNRYVLNYTLYQAPMGQDRGLFAQYPEMVENARRIVEALQALPRIEGCKSIALEGMPTFGRVFDASGQPFHGAHFAIRIVEF